MGGGRGGFNPTQMADSSFDRLVRSYGGSGDTLDYSKIPNDVREQTNMMSQRFGSPPLPTSGTVSRTDYRADIEKRMAARMGGTPGGAAPAAPTAPSSGGTVMVIGPGGTTDGKLTMTVTTSPGGGPGGPGGAWGGGQGGPGGGWGGGRGGQDADSRFQDYLQQMDTNKDSKLSRDETQANPRGGRLANAFDQIDTNKDGQIDLAEYKVYYATMTGGGGFGGGGSGWGGQGGGGWNGGGGGGWGNRDEKKVEEQEDPKPVVYRFGGLPQGLPKYFTDADYDKDGQIGLYEWVKYWESTSEAKIAEFKKLDLNNDGLLTADEYFRANNITPGAAVAAAPGGPGSFGRGPQSYGTPPVAPVPAEGTAPVSPGAALTDQSPKDDKSQRKDEKRDSRTPGDTRGPRPDTGTGGDTRGRGGFGGRGNGGSDATPPGGNPFNPNGGRNRGGN